MPREVRTQQGAEQVVINGVVQEREDSAEMSAEISLIFHR